VAEKESMSPMDPRCCSTLLIVKPHSWKRSLSDRLVVASEEEGKEGALDLQMELASPNSNLDGDGATVQGEEEDCLLCASDALPFTAIVLADTRRPGLPLVCGQQSR